jgi:hypothetical protein
MKAKVLLKATLMGQLTLDRKKNQVALLLPIP